MSMVAARAVVLGGMMLGTGIRSGPHRSAFRNKSLHPALDTMDSLQGQLLIASTGLLDPNFARTVILVAAHGEEGALGLILNREMSVPLQQVWGQVSELPCLRSGNVRHGGPVGGTLMALHDLRIHANLVVTDDVFVATELSAMESLASSDDGLALFYIGHSGWGPGPLENELAEGSWLVLPASSIHVFGEQDTNALWKEAMTEVGRRQIQSIIPIKHVPDEPGLN
jgi:putative transcriptional regulator